jgi:tryptophan-rich sensory protein
MAWFDKYTVKPPWQPPNKVFTIVWPILYVIYAITLYTQWKKTPIRNALLLGLILNFSWVPVFTVNAVAALAVLTAMIIVGIQSLLLLKKEGGYAVWLFSPYVAWISFAWTLNAYIAYRPKQAPELQAASIASASAFVSSVEGFSARGFDRTSTRPIE